MAVYFDTKVRTDHLGTNTGIYFHDVHPLLALTSYNQGMGGSVTLYNRDVSICITTLHNISYSASGHMLPMIFILVYLIHIYMLSSMQKEYFFLG